MQTKETGYSADGRIRGRTASSTIGQQEKTLATIPQSTTQPDELLRHNISDEELTMLSSYNKDNLLEAAWGFFGISGGTVIPTIEAIHKAFYSNPSISLELIDLIQIIMFSGSLLLAAALFIVRYKSNRASVDLVDQIRSRNRVGTT